ncbi:MAG TPA: PLP-dependent aminotransferase family protein, partial [Holophagaceae bacterium]|nr:PLP-dependent aminotransferase family protein [Holophagaceae bacterium]
AAYRELEAEGWTRSEARSTRVAGDLPAAPERARIPRGGLGFDLEIPEMPLPFAPPSGAKVLQFGGGLPDVRLVPTELLARAYRRALRQRSLLEYGDPRGDLRFRIALAQLLSEMRGLACGADQLFISGGSQMGLDLVARLLIRPGDRVGVEDPGYPPAWATLRGAGAELVPLPVDEGGVKLEALEAELRHGALRAIYLTPHHQFPTTVTMSAPRRLRLLELARRHRVAVLEDDYDFEFHFEGRPVLPLASADPAGVVVYIGTLSKVLAPGLRLGFVAGPQALVEALAAKRMAVDRQGDQVLERAASELIEDGLLQRHARKMRRVYEARREALVAALRKDLGGAVAFDLPPGGMSLWLRTAAGVDAEAWAHRAREAGVILYAGRRFDFRRRALPNLRLGFTALDERELREAVRRMRGALP